MRIVHVKHAPDEIIKGWSKNVKIDETNCEYELA